jgi:hypothetical protein
VAKKQDFLQLPWPMAGISSNMGFTTQEASTCVDALNVRGIDPTTNRARGAQRCGTSKYPTGQLSSSNFIQNIEHIITSAGIAVSSGSSVRTLTAVGVAGGTVKTFSRGAAFSSVTNGTSALDSTNPYIGSAILFNAIYYADGVHWKYYNAPTNTVVAMSASAGDLPTDGDGNAPRLICQWRGRLVWSGLVGDPQNWFMSRQFAPLDYDYSPASETDQNAQQAVAGNNTEAGYVPDIVNCLIPYSDDLLIFGGDHSLWQMTNDPAAGGQIDRISDTVGMAFGSPWCKDAFGNVYFFGSRGGLYVFNPTPGATAAPQRVSADKIDNSLLDVDLANNIVRMVWDDRFQTIMFFITPIDGSETFNWVYDIRNQAFWKDQFSDPDHNVTAVHLMDGDDPSDRVVLLGCYDGYIRQVDITAEDDDGTPISSYVILGPIQANSGKLRLRELRTVLGMNSDPVTVELFTGNSVEAAFDVDEPHFSATIYAGRSPAIRSGAVAQGMYLKLSNSKLRESWQYEAIYASLEGVGRAAGRQL